MASISAIRDGLATRLETITGLKAYATPPGSINVPAAVVSRQRIDFDSTMQRGSDDFTFVITLFVQWAEDQIAQDKLDAYLAGSGVSSVKAAVEADASLGGVVDYARVASAGPEKIANYAGQDFLAVDFLVEVVADGTV